MYRYSFETDEKIKDCYDCPCLAVNKDDDYYCTINEHDVHGIGKRPADCPLIETKQEVQHE